jgi:predicted HTH transcriptional regulator
MYICETRGSGILRTIEGVESFQLLGPKFINQDNAFRALMYSYKPFDSLNNEEKVHACVQHVEFMYIQGLYANNESLRKRFGLGEKKGNLISKLVKIVKDKGLIKNFDPDSCSKKFIKYIPYWA